MTSFAIKPAPADWPRLASALDYQDPAAAIGWLCDVFGFELRLEGGGEGGAAVHSELTFGGGARHGRGVSTGGFGTTLQVR